MKHELKCLPDFFVPIMLGYKNFEYRKNDRGYKNGDLLILKEWNGEVYSGREIYARVTYILYPEGIPMPPTFCIMSISIERIVREYDFIYEEVV